MKILRLKNDNCEMVEIEDGENSLQAEVDGNIEIVSLTRTLKMIVNDEGQNKADFKVNEPASALYMHAGGITLIVGKAFLCSFDGVDKLVSLTDEDYETAKKILTKYGYVKGS